MKTEVVNPNIKNFVNSLRDMGYSFNIAVADIVDNSISAEATQIDIYAVADPKLILCILDDGYGMDEKELVEAMRLATKDPDAERGKQDLGRFGLGLKTASFSQCRRLTLMSKKDGLVVIKQWDLDYLSNQVDWLLITPELKTFDNLPPYESLKLMSHGTLVIWQEIDRYAAEKVAYMIDGLRKHLSLVFHRFLEGQDLFRKLSISINNNPVKPFNPFNPNHPATQQISPEKIYCHNALVQVQPYVLPHHSKMTPQEYEQYATVDGYTASQGFYLYRENRLLIHGTWWGLHKAVDAHKLVRIKIDIPNSIDSLWGIDIKKSIARPDPNIVNDLKRIISQITEKGSRPYTGRGRKIEDKTVERFWTLCSLGDTIQFALNKEHPILKHIEEQLGDGARELLETYLNGLQAYLPLDAIQAHLNHNPYKIHQELAIGERDIETLEKLISNSNLDKDFINSLLNTELLKRKGDTNRGTD